MKLECFALDEFSPALVAAGAERNWMSEFQDRHAYRCLPLSIANASGWEILMPIGIDIDWNGGPSISDLRVTSTEQLPGNRPLDHFVKSNFSRGILTMHVGYLFRTAPGWNLIATGPCNRPKDGIYPLTGIMESDWLPYPFTMNWQMLRPGRVRFEKDEPYCLITPTPKQALAQCHPEIKRLADDPELHAQYGAFKSSREAFMKKIEAGDPRATRQGWERHYFIGRHPDGTLAPSHLHKLRLPEPKDLRLPQAAARVSLEPARVDRECPSAASDDPPQSASDACPPTIENERGRSRISSDGVLRPSAATSVVANASEAQGRDFLLIDDFYSEAECRSICSVMERMKDELFKSATIHPFWNDRFLFLADILSREPEVGRMMVERQRVAIDRIAQFYSVAQPLYSDVLQIVRWNPGQSMAPHADNANPDGSVHPMAHRRFSSVAYVNDDFEGGELYFTALDVIVKPRRGSFLAFTSGFRHEHAVLKVSGATRLTVPSFYGFELSKADPDLLARE